MQYSMNHKLDWAMPLKNYHQLRVINFTILPTVIIFYISQYKQMLQLFQPTT